LRSLLQEKNSEAIGTSKILLRLRVLYITEVQQDIQICHVISQAREHY
jgi:hypothetical protein